MAPTTPVSTLRISLTIFTDTPAGYGAEAAVDSHGIHSHTSGRRTAQEAASAVVTDLLQKFPNWMVSDRGTRKGLEHQLIESLTETDALHVAGELSVIGGPQDPRVLATRLRALAGRAVGEGANATQAAAIALLAGLAEADGTTEALMLEALCRVINSPALNQPTT
jgi:hypothetical protein